MTVVIALAVIVGGAVSFSRPWRMWRCLVREHPF
jgi:hypothetical protein